MVRAGGFLVLEPNFHSGRDKVRWERLLFFFALIAVPAILSSCGKAASTTTPPTISAVCTPTQGTGANVTVLGTAQCTATVLNVSGSTLVNWSVGGTSSGSITSAGLYTAPATVPTTNNGVVTITATSQSQSSLTATASLTIVAATAITAVTCNDSSGSPTSTVSSGNQLSCTATASSGATVPVNWSVANTNNLGGNIGSISALGNYVAPLVPPPGQKVTITATSQALKTQTMSVTVSVVFGDKVLSGSYVFSTSGRLTTHAFWARAGSFTAGAGALTGIEDTNQGGAPNTVLTQRSFTGSYSIGQDGRGTIQFCEDTNSACPLGSSSATAFFRIVVISPKQAQIIEFSSPAVASATTIAGGEFLLQDPLVFPNNGNLSGTYSFNFSGVSAGATEESVAGEFSANGFGTISPGSSVAPLAPGEMDIDAGGPVALAGTSYSISSNGRGTVTLGGLTFSFYPVSASRAKFIEIDTASSATPTTPASIVVGDAFKQQTSSTCGWSLNALSGLTVFETSGESSGVVIADVGSFTASTGVVSAASIDENSGGTVSSAVGTLSGSYTMDPCGRGALTVGAHSYVFYIISASDAVLQETTSGVIAHGFLVPSQGGPFADSTLTGSFAFRLGGTNAAGTAGQREDFLGQLTSTGSGTGVAGTLDLNDFGTTQTGVAITNGMYLPVPAASLRGTMALPLTTTPSVTTRNLVLYMVSPTLFYVLDTDPAPSGTAIGVLNNQF